MPESTPLPNPNPITYEVCRREGGGCLKLYGTTIEQVDEWINAKKKNGDVVNTFSENCGDICNRAYTSSTSLEYGVTGVKVSGKLPNGAVVKNALAIAIKDNGEYKSRPIS